MEWDPCTPPFYRQLTHHQFRALVRLITWSAMDMRLPFISCCQTEFHCSSRIFLEILDSLAMGLSHVAVDSPASQCRKTILYPRHYWTLRMYRCKSTFIRRADSDISQLNYWQAMECNSHPSIYGSLIISRPMVQNYCHEGLARVSRELQKVLVFSDRVGVL